MKTQTSQEYNPHKKKKVSKITIILLAGLVAFALYLAAAMGAALDISDNGHGVDFGLFMENFAHTITAPDMAFAALGAGGYAPQMVFFVGVAIGIFALYKYSQIKKRLHRKGTEHGSAKWGDEIEMKSLADTGLDPKFPHKEPQLIPLTSPDGTRVFDKDGEFVGVMIDNNIILTEQVYMAHPNRYARSISWCDYVRTRN